MHEQDTGEPSVQRRFEVQDFVRLLPLEQLKEVFPPEQFSHELEDDETAIKYSIHDAQRRRWLTLKLRDRQFDRPGRWFPTALTNEWGYNGPEDSIDGAAIETSKYWGDPRYPIGGFFPEEMSRFIENPFTALPHEAPTVENLLHWLNTWRDAIAHPQLPYPGQFSLYTVQGLNRYVFDQVKTLGKERGYTYITAMPTWYHVAKINEHFGFSYHDPKDAEAMRKLDDRLLEDGHNASWIVMLQFWAELAEKSGVNPELYIDPHYILRDETGTILTYPLRPDHNLWQIYRI